MKALIVVNEYYLETSNILEVNADFFYCLFNDDGLYSETDDHFYIDGFEIQSSLRLLHSLKENLITRVVLVGDDSSVLEISIRLMGLGIISTDFLVNCSDDERQQHKHS